MKHLHLTLGYLRQQRTQIDASIALLETLLGSNGNGASNGHSKTFKIAEQALAIHHERAQTDEPKKRQRKGKHWTQTAAGKRKMAGIQRKAWVARRAAEAAK